MSWVRLAVAFVLFPVGLLQGQPTSQFEPVSVIDSTKSLKALFPQPIIMARDLSPDGKQIAYLVMADVKVGAPLWLVTLEVSTKRIVASKELGDPMWVHSLNFPHQVLYSSDQRYLVVQDYRQVRVFDTGALELSRTIPIPASSSPLIALFIAGASQSDVFVCAFGAEHQPMTGLLATPVQVEVVDVASGKILGAWASEEVPQAISPNGELIAISQWPTRNPRRVVPLAVFDRNGRKIADLDVDFSFNEGFSFYKKEDPSRPLGRVIGRFVSNQEILLIPDGGHDETGHFSGESIRLVSVTGQQAPQTVPVKHFGPTGNLAVSADGQTILVKSLYYPPWILAQHHGQLLGQESKLLILGRNSGRNSKLHVESAMPLDYGSDLWVSADGSVIAIESEGITVLRRSAHP